MTTVTEPVDSKPFALAARPLTPNDWQMIQSVAPAMAAARYFAGVLKPDQAAAIMLKGFELGLPLAASFELIHVIEGKPSLSPRGAMAIVRASGLLESESIVETSGSCTVTMKRRGGPEYSLTWTLDDAQTADLIKPKSGWAKYPANMLRWRCVGYVIDWLFSDVTGGLKRADELGAEITPDGDVEAAEWSQVAAPAASVPDYTDAELRPVTPTVTLDDLLAKYTAEDIMVAFGGGIPATAEDLAVVAAILEAPSNG